MLRGSSDIRLVIGGSDGVSDEVRARADEMLSFDALPAAQPGACGAARADLPLPAKDQSWRAVSQVG